MKRPTINRLLNVGKKEWPRIILAWFLNLFLRAGFVIGWTVTIAMFINRIGIEALPYLLVINALLVMIGSILYSHLLNHIKKPLLILCTTLIGAGLLFASTLFAYTSVLAFFSLVLIAQSILLSQLNILLTLFIEDLFSPLESQRTFPLIASAETFGGIIGGLTVGLLAGILPSYKFIYLWILVLSLIIPTLLTSHNHIRKIPSLKIQQKKPSPKRKLENPMGRMAKSFKIMQNIPFLRGIIVIVMLQFMLLNILEFQYSKAVKEAVTSQSEFIAFEITEYQPTTALEVSLLDVESVNMSAKEEYLERELTKNLGMLQMVFSAGSLLVQIFAASRVISSLGIIGSLIIHPLVSLLHLIGMAFSFNFFSAAVGRSSFEITGGIFKNAYHSSYYAVSEKIRDQIKEFLEGFIKPLGAIFAFILFFVVQSFLDGNEETLALNLIMVGIAFFMTLRLIPLQKNYTELSNQNLNLENDLPTRINAIEILGQRGHKSNTKMLLKYLRNEKESNPIKLKILETLKLQQAPEAIPEIINCLKNENSEIRLASLETLSSFKKFKDYLSKKAFTRYRTIEIVKTLFQVEESEEIRAACIEVLAKIDDQDLIAFIISAMTNGNARIKRACIKACGSFKDANIIHYIENYLHDSDPSVQAETISALWQFTSLRKTLTHHRNQMKKSKKKDVTVATLQLLQEIGTKKDLPYLIPKLASSDQTIREEATKTLCTMNHPASIPHIVEFITHQNQKTSKRSKKFARTLKGSIVENIEKLVHIRISEYIREILNQSKAESLEKLDHETLQKLQNAYATVDEHEEVYKIEKIIQAKRKVSPQILKQTTDVIPV